MMTDDLRRAAAERHAPDGATYASLSLANAQRLAHEHGMPLRLIEAEALRADIVPERYQRTVASIGMRGLLALTEAHIGIAGAGGLGGTLAELLARAGAGTLSIVDDDTFEESNLNRQLMCDIDLVGKPKVRAAHERIARVNPATEVRAVQDRIDDDNAASIFAETHVIADALGNITPRFILERAARALGKPLVHAAVAGNRGQLVTIYPGDPGLKAVYGSPSTALHAGRETVEGTPPAPVWAVAALAAHEIVRIITGAGAAHRNRLAVIDLDNCTYRHFTIPV